MSYIRIRYKKQGGHYHCRLFTARSYLSTYAKCGELVFDEHEFTDVRDKLSRCEWLEENDAPSKRGYLGTTADGGVDDADRDE